MGSPYKAELNVSSFWGYLLGFCNVTSVCAVGPNVAVGLEVHLLVHCRCSTK